MTRDNRNSDDQIGKVFIVLPCGLLRCLACEEIFSKETATEHAEVDCYPFLELCLLEPVGHKK